MEHSATIDTRRSTFQVLIRRFGLPRLIIRSPPASRSENGSAKNPTPIDRHVISPMNLTKTAATRKNASS